MSARVYPTRSYAEPTVIEEPSPPDRPCPLCGGEQRAVWLDAPSVWRHVSCGGCGLVYVSPLPASLGALNEGIYGHASSERASPGRGRLPRRHRRELAFLGRRRGSGALLDVGCGAGRFLLAADRLGWTVAGVDLAEQSARAAVEAGLDVRCAALADAGFEEGRFDAVRLNQVIEHAVDPLGLLRAVALVTKPGGVLSLATPNVTSVSARRLGVRWQHLGRDGNGHVALFSRETLAGALSAAGFRPLAWKTIGLRLQPRRPGLAGRLVRVSARVLTPLAEATGRGGRLHVFAERL